MKITIESIWDEYYCDLCGTSRSEGFEVLFENGETLTLTPIAHCYSGHDWSEKEMLVEVLEHLGHELEFLS